MFPEVRILPRKSTRTCGHQLADNVRLGAEIDRPLLHPSLGAQLPGQCAYTCHQQVKCLGYHPTPRGKKVSEGRGEMSDLYHHLSLRRAPYAHSLPHTNESTLSSASIILTFSQQVLSELWGNMQQDIILHRASVRWSSDIWSFRLFGQFLAGPEWEFIHYNISYIWSKVLSLPPSSYLFTAAARPRGWGPQRKSSSRGSKLSSGFLHRLSQGGSRICTVEILCFGIAPVSLTKPFQKGWSCQHSNVLFGKVL